MKTLIWKELREQRLFFFLAVGIIALSRAVFPVFFYKGPLAVQYEAYANLLSHFILPILFSLFLATISFINDFTRNTKQFLLSQPITVARLFWVKYFSGLLLLLILVLLSFLTFSAPFEILFYGTGAQLPILYLFLSITILYSATCLSSLLLKDTLPAILCTPFIMIFGIFLVAPLLVASVLISPNSYIFVFSVFSAIQAVFLILSFITWQKAIVKDNRSLKTVFVTTVVILICSLGIHAIANAMVTLKMNKTIQQAKATDIKLTLEEIIPPPVPNEENAALVYEEAFKLAERLENKYKEEWKYMPYERIKTEKLTEEQKRTISRIMKDPEFVKFYALIEKAVNMSACRFDINYEEGLEMLLPHLAKIRMLARLIAAKTYILYEEKQFQEAFQLAKTGLLLENALVKEPIFISQLVRIATDKIAIDSFQQLIDKPGDRFSFSEYQALIKIIDKKNRRLMRQSLEGEIVFGGEVLFKSFRRHLSWEQLFPPPDNGIETQFLWDIFLWNIYGSYLGRPVLKEDYASFIHAITNLMQITDEPYYLVKEKHDDWEKKFEPEVKLPPRHILTRMLIPAYSRSIILQANYQATLDTFKLALALKIYKEKHGNYPDTLAPLTPEIIKELPLDPFIGKYYIYRKEGKGFIICSVGSNEKDDNGLINPIQNYDDISFKVTN